MSYSKTVIVVTSILLAIIVLGLILLVVSQAANEATCEELGLPVTCTTDAQCGPTGFFGQPYCKDGNVWQGFYQSSCRGGAGTCDSYCESTQAEREIAVCPRGCSQGRCVD